MKTTPLMARRSLAALYTDEDEAMDAGKQPIEEMIRTVH